MDHDSNSVVKMQRKRHTHSVRKHHHHNWVREENAGEYEAVAFAQFEPPTATVERRAAPTVTCGPKDNTGLCEKPTAAMNNTIPIILGSA